MKRAEAAIIILVVFFSLPAFSQFKDVTKDQAAYNSVQKLLKEGVINLPPNKKFDGEAAVDRYQMAFTLDRVLARIGKINEIEARLLEQFYTDVPSKHYAYKAVQDLTKLGLFNPADAQTFVGEAKLDRYTFYSLMAAFLERVEERKLPAAPPASVYPDVPADNPAYVYIQKLIGAGLLSGKGNFDGDKLVNRYEMAGLIARILDYYSQGRQKEEAKEIPSEYSDIPADDYARQAVNELVEEGILTPGPDRKFYGGELINRYLLVDFMAKIIEKIMVGEEGELEPANFERSYKDVPASNFAYRSIQKMIKAEVIPSGNRLELFYGDRRISRYQMAFFVFSAIQSVLSDVTTFKPADPSLGYADAPRDHFVYETIQKLINLGVLAGGENNRFNGEEFVNRYELAYFTVNLIKAVYLRLKEIETFAPQKPIGYGFQAFMNTQLAASQITNGRGPGLDSKDLSALQSVTVSLDRAPVKNISVFAALTSRYYFGSAVTFSSPSLSQAYVLLSTPPYTLQTGRSGFYQGYTPFGNSLFVDTASDMVLGSYDHKYFNLYASVGKLMYAGEVGLDSNFGFLSLTPKLPPALSWLEFSLGNSLITNLPDPTFTYALPTRLVQNYFGVKFNLFNLFDLTAEKARLTFSNASVLPLIGTSANEDTEAAQYSLSYTSMDYGYSLSFGYQKIGDDYYLSTLAAPAYYLNAGQGSESWLFKTKVYPSATQNAGVDFANIDQNGINITVISGSLNTQLYKSTYLSLILSKTLDNSLARRDQLGFTASLSVSL